ncbi:DUF222 domain-containing protein [uncultured Gordonia sp.]|uniref:DUF222 domain-containing protein n=1 Tax=uncultured Gordonia sp. TaxID=198437 RepID=UPI00259072CF|nr:DUF222 domain-containing protein [uncultured Gordonia sp.]
MTGERVSTAGLWSSPSVWPVLLEPILAGIPDSSDIPNSSDIPVTADVPLADGARDEAVNESLCAMIDLERGKSYLAYEMYGQAWRVAQSVRRVESSGTDHSWLLCDEHAQVAARFAHCLSLSQRAAEELLSHAIALHTRLPKVLFSLRDGQISADLVKVVISHTELVDGREIAADVDAEIAVELGVHRGAWSRWSVATMVDRIVFRHDRDAVRERRRRATDGREMTARPTRDGMGRLSVTMSAEDMAVAVAGVRRLADAVCPGDGRTVALRCSDACFALLSGTVFECRCGSAECTAVIPEPGTVPPMTGAAIVHVIADASTVAAATATPADEVATPDEGRVSAGFLIGHGVIADTQVAEIVTRPGTVVRPVVPAGTVENGDGSFTVPAYQPSDPHRPSSALDTFVRVRDGVGVNPGDATPSFAADVEHVEEFDHDNPAAGGQTSPDNLNIKSRFFHLLKTFGTGWLDMQYRDGAGRLRTEFVIPEGLVVPGKPENLEVLFPGLRQVRFTPPRARQRPAGGEDEGDPEKPGPRILQAPRRSMTRVAAKHARRRAERERNRRRRENGTSDIHARIHGLDQ